MKITNLSGASRSQVMGWLPPTLQAEAVIVFPDACPSRGPLPTGTVTLTQQQDWRRFAISDVGCGMQLLRSKLPRAAFDVRAWACLAHELRGRRGQLGDLGSGNHFLDALEPYTEDRIYFLIHTGSRNESNTIDDLVDQPRRFDRRFAEVRAWAAENRWAVAEIVARFFGPLELVVDRDHNHTEETSEGLLVRKGAVCVSPGELTIIPSSLEGDVVLVRATDAVVETYSSLCHGTGRRISRGAAKAYADSYDFAALRRRIAIPAMISDASIRTEAPFCYRDLDECLDLIRELVQIEQRFTPFAYIGQL